jgi:hypothetical protein
VSCCFWRTLVVVVAHARTLVVVEHECRLEAVDRGGRDRVPPHDAPRDRLHPVHSQPGVPRASAEVVAPRRAIRTYGHVDVCTHCHLLHTLRLESNAAVACRFTCHRGSSAPTPRLNWVRQHSALCLCARDGVELSALLTGLCVGQVMDRTFRDWRPPPPSCRRRTSLSFTRPPSPVRIPARECGLRSPLLTLSVHTDSDQVVAGLYGQDRNACRCYGTTHRPWQEVPAARRL